MYISLVFFEMQTTHTGHSLVTVTTIIAHDLITHETHPKKNSRAALTTYRVPTHMSGKNLDFSTRDVKNQDHFSTISGL